MDISTRAVLVELHISIWQARKHDRKVSQDVARDHGTDERAGRYIKRLVPEDLKSYKTVWSEANALRKSQYTWSLPWRDGGARIVPVTAYDEYSQQIAERTGRFDAAVAAFVREYPEVRASARIHLNGLYREADYPSNIAGLFGVEVIASPVPAAHDWRVDLSEEQTGQLRSQLEREIGRATTAAQADIWDRLREALDAMKARLGDPEGVFRDSLFGNLDDLCRILPRLDLAGDPRTAAVCEDIRRSILARCTPQQARDVPAVRDAAAAEVARILATVARVTK